MLWGIQGTSAWGWRCSPCIHCATVLAFHGTLYGFLHEPCLALGLARENIIF